MLIIPLHQPLTLARFPWVTAALILINVLVYFGLQARDQRAYTSAAEFYQRTGLIERHTRHCFSRRPPPTVANDSQRHIE